MSGKVYTMKEMKNIVTYLTEHKAYGEIRGRKMWVDFANSNSTTRTWQSLKETFLKRILPDIHNPYYNLTREQIISFRQGYDVDERDKNKLQIEVVAEIHKNNDQHVISSDDEAMVQGENDKCSNIISKDISEKNNCYETVDDIRRDLESPKVVEDKKQKDINLEKKPPALVNVLKDFASDSEDCLNNIEDISAVQIEEKTDSVPLQHNDTGKKETDSVDDVQHVETDTVEVKSEKDNSMEEPSQPNNTDNDTDKQISEKVVPTESGNKKVIEKDTSNDILEISTPNNKNTESDKKNENSETVTTPTKSSCQPLTNSTSDTILPNNQEGLKDQTQNNTKTDDLVESKKISSNHTRKRSSSAETVLLENKRHKRNSTSNISKKNCNPEENASDLEIFDVHGSDSAKERATSTQIDKAKNTSANAIKSDDEEPQTQNPCLKSVSLFAEQFNKIKYSDTTSDENAVEVIDPKPSGSKDPKKNQKEIVKDDVVVLKSHSESESDEEPQEKRPAVSKRVTRAQRDKALANVFGFTSGAVSSNRNRKSNQNRVRRPHNVHHINNVTDSESSEWTTDTEQDNFISPPRCRQNRKTRKYMKPKSTRILSLEEEGGLFVMYGKRIYPVVKDGRIVKNYLIYESNSDSGFEQDSYWKAKYAELKKKYEDNKKTKEPSERLREKRQGSATREPSSPILQSNIRKNPTTAQNRDIHAPSTSNTKPAIDSKEVVNYPVENKMSTDKIMIKYTINNAEVQLEGHWPQICPIFDKVLDILPRKTDPQMEVANNKLEVHEPSKVISSGESTPVIVTADYVQEKIDKLESEIFREIEEKDKQEKIEKTEDEQMERKEDEQMEQNKKENPNNVTTRKRGRPMQTRPKQSMPPESPKSSKKQLRTNKVEQELSTPIAKPTLEIVEKQSNAGPVENSPQVVKRRTRRSMKVAQDAHNVEDLKTNKVTPKQSNVTEETQEDDVRYMFPSTTPQTNTNRQKPKSFAEKIVFQNDDCSLVSESTQGYQDSDISPVKLKSKRKLKLSTITYRNKLQKKRNQRKSYPYLLQDASTDSSNTSFCQSLKSKTSKNSSEIYKSDSYQYLFPHNKKSFNRLEPINEMGPMVNEAEMRAFDAVCRNQLNTDMDSDTLINGNVEVGSSSNVSLPHSPELSVVEDISIGKEFLDSITVYHSLKNTQTNENTTNEEQNKYLITDVDITMPLMEQMCVLQKSNSDVVMKNLPNNSSRQKKPSVSESLLNKICTVNINDNSSVSDSLDIQLRDLLLESAKKMSKTQSKYDMEIDDNILNTIQKAKARKRCSTPRKKKETIKSKLLSAKAIDEQHTEACLYVGRKTCPPSIQIHEENAGNISKINTKTIEEVRDKPKGRKKKDVIKVKILRPRTKSISKENKENSSRKSSRMSVCTDSGINGTESGISFPISNDSVELIHNHSETCLHANECLDNSVEFIDPSTTLISINSNSMTTDLQDSKEFRDAENLSLCSINNNVKGLACKNIKCIKTYTNESNREPINKCSTNNEVLNSSLLTEDLSDEAPVQSRVPAHLPGWYLLSEDETTNTNFVSTPVANTGGSGSNLNQIFPVTCAIPDLSTITEMSKENDSRKPFGLDSFTKDSNSQNIFL